jgi:hypothetical protein
VVTALEELQPELLEVAREARREQPFPLVPGREAVRRRLRPVEAQRFAELRIGPGQ